MSGWVDAHHHVWRLSRGGYGWLRPELPIHRDYGLEDLRPQLGPVDTTVLVQADATEAETAFLLEVARGSGGLVRGVVGWTDLAAPGAPARIAALAADPWLKGLRPMLQDLPEADWILRPEVRPGLEAMARHGLRLDLLLRADQLGLVPVLARRHPDLPMVIDHGAKPPIREGRWHPWASRLAAAAAMPSVHCKLSGLVTEAAPAWTEQELEPWAGHMLACFGPERMIWGSDWPVLELAGSYPAWQDVTSRLLARCTGAERAAVLGGNARRFYGLG
ncbi:amidohydrolase [Roseomonas sp. KE0001]|uniref:amidohydrolase family protein n=1 Tax=Roseomonas sp. KE0001 TaxID=2479201 RepID=UPI0018DF57E3|nr:amidohydrolase family protein [Roseomonas sp. KE0001]MBI0434541.1 amidohydrolase [Roseomonas sp. KE0001]